MDVKRRHKYCLKEHIIFNGFDDGGVIFDLCTRVSCEINQTGVEVLELMNGQRELEEIIQATAQAFEQPEKQIKKDIIRFLANLLERGWIYVR